MAGSEAESSSLAFKVFTFKDDDENSEESLSVTIPEVLDPQFGMYVWPCAVVLAQFLWNRRRELKNKTVLELGAGVSLPGVVASLLGSSVLLSDSAELPQCLKNCARSCHTNRLKVTAGQKSEVVQALGQRSEVTPNLGQRSEVVQVVGLSWGHISPRLLSLPKVDLVLGSDVFYDPQDFESVLVTVSFLFRKNPLTQFWTTYQVRSSDWSLELLLSRWRMACELVPLGVFEADKPELAGSRLPGNHSIQMMVITPGDGRWSLQQQHTDDNSM
ncbi:methyltransferase-like protein 23 [Periophthalmus magnuspinnatus]|uniref:methyltransferase-like protein 23 n=1 Tax=Periophthalmus magnuspinnatus TaxID=409849 RepID=UPI00145ADDB9|nr:methyltransferase-like protein 23 [Periophthalmus magnuspinnatus]